MDFVRIDTGDEEEQIADFLKQVMKENASVFDKVSSVQVMAYLTENDAKNAVDPLGISQPLVGLGEDEAGALLVVVPDSGKCNQFRKGCKMKHLQYKRMSVESTCRKYLDAIARQVAIDYCIPKTFQNPKMGDVIHALDHGTWLYKSAKRKRGAQQTPLRKHRHRME
jgi:hypothetical protein